MKNVTPAQLGPVLRGLGEAAGDEFGKILQRLSLAAFRELVRRSAKDTGFLRSNWDVTTNAPPNTAQDNPYKGRNTVSSASWPNTKIETGDAVVLYNNTEYAMYLEEGTPLMRAQPMIEPTYRSIYRKAVVLSKAFSKEQYNV